MAKKKGPEMYEGKPVLVAADSKKLAEAVDKFKADYPDIPLEAPYVVRVKGKKTKKNAFENDNTVGVVILHDNVEVIAGGAFWGCQSLTEVIIPDSVTKIDYSAFWQCTSLASITIPDSVVEFGAGILYGCSALAKVVLPNTMTTIEDDFFRGCSSLTSIEIPATVTWIRNRAFRCSGLTGIVIPASVTSIETDAFSQCPSLTRIEVAAGNSKYDSRNACNAIIDTEKNCLEVGCAGTVIPDSVTKIGANAFNGCTSLDTIVIPASVTDMKGYAFEGCTGLTSIVVAAGNEKYDSRNSCNAIIETETNTLILACQNTVIPDSVKTIGYLSFSTSAKSVIIPETITGIEHCAFKDCKGLESITIPSSVSVIPDSAFEGCTDLTSINIPDSVTEIGDYAFVICIYEA